MDRKSFKINRRTARALDCGFAFEHGGARYYADRTNCHPIGPSGLIRRRVGGEIALALAGAAHARQNLGLRRACRELVRLARDIRLGESA